MILNSFKPTTLAKWLLGLVLVFSCLSLVTACDKPDAYDSHDLPFRLADYRGKWVLINVWATWCAPCVKELPELNAFYRAHPKQVMVIGVNFDHISNQAIRQFAKKVAVTFPMLQHFPFQRLGIETIETLPVTFLISPDGTLKQTLHGPQTQQGLESLLRTSLNGKQHG